MIDIRLIAQQLIDASYQPTPLTPRTKDAYTPGWNDPAYQAPPFRENDNVGLRLGVKGTAPGGRCLVDADLDCSEAVVVADVLLVKTNAEFGRPGKPRSHRLYMCDEPINAETFEGLGGTDDMIVELRGCTKTGKALQTMAPPSVHPSNEQVTGSVLQPFYLQLPDQIENFKLAFRNIWIAVLIARGFPGPGNHHHPRLALAGYLYRLGLAERDIRDIGIAVMRIIKGDEQDWRNTLLSTLSKLKAGDASVTGGPTLADCLTNGADIIAKINKRLGKAKPDRRQPVLRKLADVAPEQTDWLWQPYVPLAKVTLIEGDPGDGKSHLSLAIGTAVSLGTGLPNNPDFEPQNVLLMNAEDGLGDTVRPRLDAMGGDVERIYAIDGPLLFDDVGLKFLDDQIEATSARLLVIDPWVAYVGAKLNIDKANETRGVLFELSELAKRRNVAIVLIRHITKGNRDKAIYRGIGSIDITAACRSVMLVGKDAQDPTRRAMVHIKHNLSAPGPSIGYTIENGRFLWTGTSTVSAGDILAPEGSGERGKLEDAIEVLETTLKSGPRPEGEIRKRLEDLDISNATFRRAKRELKIRSAPIRSKKGKIQGWELSLPEPQQSLPDDSNNPFA